jgi:hypothetical protein
MVRYSARSGHALQLTYNAGYTTFKPAFEARELEKLKEEFVCDPAYTRCRLLTEVTCCRERAASELGPNMIEISAQRNETATLLEENAQNSKAI